jgi:hypothetical protein
MYKKEYYELGNFEFVTFFHPSTSELFCEAKSKSQLLVKGTNFLKYKPEIPDGEFQVHVHTESNKIFALSKDTINTDKYLGLRMFSDVYRQLVARYSGLLFRAGVFLDTVDNVYFFLPISKLSTKQLHNEFDVLTSQLDWNSFCSRNSKGFEDMYIQQKLSERLKELNMELLRRHAVKAVH